MLCSLLYSLLRQASLLIQGANIAAAKRQMPKMKEAAFASASQSNVLRKTPGTTGALLGGRNPTGRISSRPFVGSPLLKAWANPKVYCDSALRVKLYGAFPVHFVDIEYAFTASQQHAKELIAFNPIIGHVENPFPLQCN